jgi:hypothetical protein
VLLVLPEEKKQLKKKEIRTYDESNQVFGINKGY